MRTLPSLRATGRCLPIVLGALSLTACSTILRGTSQDVAVQTPGADGATCQVTGGDGVKATVVTPGNVHLPKSKVDIRVACVAPDGRQADKTFASNYSDYSYVMWPPGYLVDGVSGAMWVYPTTLQVPIEAAQTQR